MFAIANSIGLFGMNAFSVTVEAEIEKGRPSFDISGLPDAAVKEARDRVFSALLSVGHPIPANRVLMNLAPANVRKSGTTFDLAMFVALMQALGTLPPRLPDRVFIGELGLNGTLHGIRGVLSMVMMARSLGFREIYVPQENVREASVIDGIEVFGVETAQQLLDHLLELYPMQPAPVWSPTPDEMLDSVLDFSDIRGQEKARTGVELAAAGGHNMIMIGPPGSGKSMMAKRLPSILPPLTLSESLETTKVYSVAGKLSQGTSLLYQRPFRSPHHSISQVALVGGGVNPRPGEISLAHNGVLFCDELPEFSRSVLEVMRQPLEDRTITISRAKYSIEFPCSFMFVASMNPCPCGYYGDPTHHCVCTPGQIQRYLNKISGPLLDRIDIQCEIQAVPFAQLSQMKPGESSATIRERVIAARKIQEVRFKEHKGIHCNAMMTESMLHQYAEPDESSLNMLRMAMERLKLSARAYSRILKVARTIADLAGSEKVETSHITEAIGYRTLDRGDWAERG